ncbi:malto-oligosyltrehalose synthase [Pseudomonas sp. TE3786]
MRPLTATVRLQFHQDFTLNHAVPLVSYFAALGISHIYASPILKARPGSTHGYDVVDPTCINPELGGEEALLRLVAELRVHGMGLILDIVSNHMAVGGDANPWWLDVLEWGPTSPYANFFDIQWRSHDPLMVGQLLVPFLRSDYGEVLGAGEIQLNFDADTGNLYAQHYEHRFPLTPPTYADVLKLSDDPTLQAFAARFEGLDVDPLAWHSARQIRTELAEVAQVPEVGQALADALSHFEVVTGVTDGEDGKPAFNNLHQLLERQHYRLASWRTAADDINWRRFFDINELGGLRVERNRVFEATHGKIFQLIQQGLVDGLRIDHVDGLANPGAYCRKLRRRVNGLLSKRPQALANQPFPIYVEKILGAGETLPGNWAVDGTTGYEFMNEVSQLQHDPIGQLQLAALWEQRSGRTANFMDEVREARQLVLNGTLAGDLEALAQGLLLVARDDIASRDLTLGSIRRALLELIVHFPVYRTYAGGHGRSAQDQLFFQQALHAAHGSLGEADWPLLGYLDRWLGGQALRQLPPGPARKQRQKLLTRFQQLTSPAAAKAVEDTACYRSAVLLSRNDVGFDPQHFSLPVSELQASWQRRGKQFPDNLLTTATHDHKRGEDTRARLAVLSERSTWLVERIDRWWPMAAALREELPDGIAPSPGDELMLYQTLLGSWPLGLTGTDQPRLDAYLQRLLGWQQKALREAKLRSSWNANNDVYEGACRRFLEGLLQRSDAVELRSEIAAAAESLAPSAALNGLAQALLRMTTPGVPDLYQGNEFWDFSLVDPDNRRPVDYALRRSALEHPRPLSELIHQWRGGQLKQWLVQRTLNLRAEHHAVFARGQYLPLPVEGSQATRLLAFARHLDDERFVIVLLPRLAAGLLDGQNAPLIADSAWGDTQLLLPEHLSHHSLKSAFTTSSYTPVAGRLDIAHLLRDFPVNLLHPFQEPRP